MFSILDMEVSMQVTFVTLDIMQVTLDIMQVTFVALDIMQVTFVTLWQPIVYLPTASLNSESLRNGQASKTEQCYEAHATFDVHILGSIRGRGMVRLFGEGVRGDGCS